jgi:hypothetical protein
MKLSDCYNTKMRWKEYEVGGRNYIQGKHTALVETWKKQYADGGCGADNLLEECKWRELYMQNLQNSIFVNNQQNNIGEASAWTKVLAEETKKFNDLGCNAKIQQSRNVVVEDKLSKYTALDKQRIEAESKYQANKKIFIGVSVLLVAVALVVVIKSE